jgi:hypothetical protein
MLHKDLLKAKENKIALKILYFLLSIDIAFLVLDVFNRYTGYFGDVRFYLTVDHSYAEFYQYAKELFIAMAFVRLSYLRRLPGYLVWSGLFVYFFFDDAFCIHENLGRFIVSTFGYGSILGLRAQDFGELTAFAFFGLLFFCLIVFSFLRCDHEHRKIWQHLMLLIVMLAVCGIGFDMAHSIFSSKVSATGPISLSSVLGAMEDVGEMIVMSLCVWYVLKLYCKEKREMVVIKNDS